MSRVAGALLLLLLMRSRGGTASGPGTALDDRATTPASGALAVSVSETPATVLLHIQASGDVEPGSIEVRFARRKTVVLARDAAGRSIRSQSLRLPEEVIEEEASADYDADGGLVMTLRKQSPVEDAVSGGDAEAR